MRLKKCSGCARAIVESATACDYCGHQAADPIAHAPGVDKNRMDLESLFELSPDDSTPSASAAATPPPVEEPAGADDGEDAHTAPLFDFSPKRSVAEPAGSAMPPVIEHSSDVHAEDATRWFDGLDVNEPPVDDPADEHPVDVPELQSAGVSEAAAAAVPEPAVIVAMQAAPETPARSGLGRVEMMIGLGVAVASGILIVAMMGARGVAAPAATATSASNPAKPARTAPSPTPGSAMTPESAPARAATPRWTSNAAAWVGRERNSAAFELPSINRVNVWMRQAQPVLVVRCQAHKAEAFVFTSSAAKMEPEDENHTVRIQFDGGAAATERWADSSEHDALFAPDGAAFVQRLVSARQLKFGFSPHNADPVVATFEVDGLAAHLASAARQCGWKPLNK